MSNGGCFTFIAHQFASNIGKISPYFQKEGKKLTMKCVHTYRRGEYKNFNYKLEISTPFLHRS